MSWDQNEESDTRLMKWPFFVANVLLIASASALAFRDAEPLGAWEMIAIVLLIGVGCVLLPLPYMIEMATRMRHRELEHAQLERTNARRNEASLLSLQEASESFTHQSNRFEHLRGSLEKSVKDLESRLAVLEESVKVLDSTGEDLREWLAERDNDDRLPASTTDSAQPRSAEPILLEAVQELRLALQQIDARVSHLTDFQAQRKTADEADVEATLAARSAPPTESSQAADGCSEETHPEHSARAPLLEEPQPAKTGFDTTPTSHASPAGEPPSEEVAVEAPMTDSAAAADRPTPQPASEPEEPVVVLSSPSDAAKPKAKRRRAARVAKAAEPSPMESGLVANVLIGIGNVPYIRGDGGGLSKTKGKAMEFVEIGKWRWVPPEPLEGP
ncbi:MAG: hypothetical protein ACFBZ8_10705, partial [Opitutales bacterium]